MVDESPKRIESKANPRFKQLKKIIQDHSHYKRAGWVWLEGEHLVEAALAQGVLADACVMSEDHARQFQSTWASPPEVLVLTNELFAQLSALPSSASIGMLIKPTPPQALDPRKPTVVMDRIQDAGNVGSILRSAAAFGFSQVIALKGTAALWGAKTLRAAMGAHFSLDLHEDVAPEDLAAIEGLPWLATSSHAPSSILGQGVTLPWPCAWFLGNEGQGLDQVLEKRCQLRLRINQPGGQESLNVAAAAAICLFASSQSRS